jgi:hypothetical protein
MSDRHTNGQEIPKNDKQTKRQAKKQDERLKDKDEILMKMIDKQKDR